MGKFDMPKGLHNKVPFSSEYIEDGALIKNIEYLPVKNLLEKINKLEGLKLKSRGEAHITVITPPEARGWFSDHKGINYFISSLELHEKYFRTLQNTKFEPICIGKQQNKKGDKVYYIVIKSQDLLKIRKDIYKELKQRASFTNRTVSFTPDKYDPHITIGFIGNDIHGVSKDIRTCVYYFNK